VLLAVQRLTQERDDEILGVAQDSRFSDGTPRRHSAFEHEQLHRGDGRQAPLIVEFPNRRPYTVKLGDLSEARPKPRGRKAASLWPRLTTT
jgi:hypothetical protein